MKNQNYRKCNINKIKLNKYNKKVRINNNKKNLLISIYRKQIKIIKIDTINNKIGLIVILIEAIKIIINSHKTIKTNNILMIPNLIILF